MKQAYLFILGFLSLALGHAQVLTFTDEGLTFTLLNSDNFNEIALDAAGNSIDIDTNNDQMIQQSEALNVYTLNLNNRSLNSLEGIAGFINLRRLYCDNNFLASLDLSGLTNLLTLQCANNDMTSLQLTGPADLREVQCNDNQLNSLDITVAPNLSILACNNNQLTTIDFSNNAYLTSVNCNYNQLTNLNLGSSQTIQEVFCHYNMLTSINVTSIYLRELDCSHNNLSSLELVTESVFFRDLDCSYNQLTDLNISGVGNIETLNCKSNQLTNINVANHLSLDSINCGVNLLTSLDLTNLPTLSLLLCNNNNLTTLDISRTGGQLSSVLCSGNPYLLSLLMKKIDIDVDTPEFSECPALRYVCVKESDISAMQLRVASYGYVNCNVNSYCTFNPAGAFSTLSGDSRFTVAGACSQISAAVPFMKYQVSDTTGSRVIVSDSSGHYSFPFQGATTVYPFLQGITNSVLISPAVLSLPIAGQSDPYGQDFCINVNPAFVSEEIEVSLIPIRNAVPGMELPFKLNFRNRGNVTQSGIVTLTFDDAVMNFVSSSASVQSQTPNQLQWAYSNLAPLETETITINFQLSTPVDAPALNAGDILLFNASLTGINDSEHSVNSSLMVYSSLDPNDKTCLEGNAVTPDMAGKFVHYMIRFENTGTANAQNIVVKDIINLSQFDIDSLDPIDGSGVFTTRINGNKVEFIFENINLPFDDANNDGFVAFKIKIRPTLGVGNSFSNTASIYFDYNFPIVTNTATTTISQLAVSDFDFDDYFTIWPNPVDDVLNIEAKKNIAVSSLTIYNLAGQLLITQVGGQKSVNVSALSAGNYVVNIKSEKGATNARFVKL